MYNDIGIYKQKGKVKMIIIPAGIGKIGLSTNHAKALIINTKSSYEEIGEMLSIALELSKNKKVLESEDIKEQIWSMASGYTTYGKFSKEYNGISLRLENNIYDLLLLKKDGMGYSEFRDENDNEVEYTLKKEETSYEELAKKIMEMFEYKEKYDEI
jgi:hypothetical protein fgonA2_04805